MAADSAQRACERRPAQNTLRLVDSTLGARQLLPVTKLYFNCASSRNYAVPFGCYTATSIRTRGHSSVSSIPWQQSLLGSLCSAPQRMQVPPQPARPLSAEVFSAPCRSSSVLQSRRAELLETCMTAAMSEHEPARLIAARHNHPQAYVAENHTAQQEPELERVMWGGEVHPATLADLREDFQAMSPPG